MASTAPFAAISRVLASLDGKERLRVLGADGSFTGLLLARAALELGGPIVHIAVDDARARAVAADVAFFMGVARPEPGAVEGPILVVPEIDTSPYADLSPDPRTVAARLAALDRLADDRDTPKVVVFGLRSWMRKVMSPAALRALSSVWQVGEEVGRERAVSLLARGGYQRVEVVEDPGTFAVRGGVMDVYVPRLRFPVRLEWFGDEIEHMRLFDPDSQRSLRDVVACAVHPVRETVVTTRESLRARILACGDATLAPTSRTRQVIENVERGVDFFGIDALTPIFHDDMVPPWIHLPKSSRFVAADPDALLQWARHVEAELGEEYEQACSRHMVVAPPESFLVAPSSVRERISVCPVVVASADVHQPATSDERAVLRVEIERNAKLRAELAAARTRKGGELLRPIVDHIRALDRKGPPWSATLVAPNLSHAERLSSLLRGYGLQVQLPRSDEHGPPDFTAPDVGETQVRVVAGSLSEGFASASERVFLLAEEEVFGRMTRRSTARRRPVGLGSLTQVSIGDYVVHVVHGIGRYQGLSKLVLRGVPGDFVQIEYAGNDRLYLPVYRLGEIERYVSAEAKPPRLDRMGGATFQNKARKVKAQVRAIAEELLQIYAQRAALTGHSFAEPDDLQREFDATFPFEETPDQEDAIAAVHRDLSAPQPMDRLICGDVGFGKTEVALRAAFRVAANGKQVAVLAPTTVLVQQHHATFRDRMERFGVRVAFLNRFLSVDRRRQVVAGIRDGTIDVVIGTHRLLSGDVRFKDLGLLVIDEEQRFGVAQKERFKKLKTQVDVLTMTATPIPRTLHMSLLGIREISTIMTPPVDRLAIRTHLTRPSDQVISDGVRKELARGGQVFYVVPKIQGIDEHARRIRELVPEARVVVGHGQMPADRLESTMVDFVEHRADVLVSTTIIESGLDIPRANTMFVARADMFGLAQLYQLRGRIGRSRHRAYCYLMVSSLERLAGDARRRLEAIQRYSELGSGFLVASHDLEIRGAGEILGARQSGNIAAVGFEAYARILEEAVAELRGQPISHETDPEVSFDVPAFLPDAFVVDVGQRLDLYRRLSAARDADEVGAIMEEISDRFGELPPEARWLALAMKCKTYGRKLHALALELHGRRFSVRIGPGSPLLSRVASAGADPSSAGFRLLGTDRVAITVPASRGEDHTARLQACVAALVELVTSWRSGEAAQ